MFNQLGPEADQDYMEVTIRHNCLQQAIELGKNSGHNAKTVVESAEQFSKFINAGRKQSSAARVHSIKPVG